MELADWYCHLSDYDPGGSMYDHFMRFDTGAPSSHGRHGHFDTI
jgi:hypothetical protein